MFLRMGTEKSLSRLTIDLPAETHRKLKVAAAAQGTSMKELVLAWIRTGLATPPKKGK